MSGANVLWVIAGLESTWGVRATHSRPEPGYGPKGIYFRASLWDQWGALAGCSVGAWQVMYPVAVELGCHDAPWRLIEDHLIGGYWATEYLLKRALGRGAATLTEVLDAYNSGTHRDSHVPHAYIALGLSILHTRPLPD